MRRWWLALLVGVLAGAGVQAESALPQHILLASDVWEKDTEADGTGLTWDILRRVFEPAGVELVIQSVPYTRSIGLVRQGEADAWVGSYLHEVDSGVVYPRWHYDSDQVSALGLSQRPAPTLASLASAQLVWLRGYAFQRYLPNLKHYREVRRDSDILRMLQYKRADFYIDAQDEIEKLLEGASDSTSFRITPLISQPLYLGFADTSRGRALALLYDQRMDVLVKNGSLRPLFTRWQQPYPFD
ncbi:ABC transporter substrate-binding protein [Pseudomonas taeanensis MS-3]|uniref:ABC transporter substrate-binding protein n=1 Tax=Pseudomonas taeanensis MS-3 TaxID=1395571 RepID=A0A0A1YG04_9PSED|nr:ABC transporter substrate-binding protein [Pseudomonas taeanensis MS-3]